MKFDDKQKVALIKEVKNLLEGMNLVQVSILPMLIMFQVVISSYLIKWLQFQAKKFVESAPTVIKADIGKDEAEKLKEAFTKVGAECVIDWDLHICYIIISIIFLIFQNFNV